jgi:hypothetical protein
VLELLLVDPVAAQRPHDKRPPPAPPGPPPPTEYINRDGDNDAIPDRIETALLARFTPYLRFALDGGVEQYRPMGVWPYVMWSVLQSSGDEGKGVIIPNAVLNNDPLQLLSAGTNLIQNYRFQGDRYLNPLTDVPHPGGNWARYGYDWPEVMALRNVGLYGHVVPYRATPPQTDFLTCPPARSREGAWADLVSRDYVQCNIDIDPAAPRTYYKVEYWQFFGYNGVGKPFDLGEHEGDWTTVQVIVYAETMAPLQIFHFAHGYRIGFDLQSRPYAREIPAPGMPPVGPIYPDRVLLEDGLIAEYRGIHFGKEPQFTWWDTDPAHQQNDNSARSAQNNVVRMMRDPETGEYTHPVVYVEHGGHEFWPVAEWGYQDSPNHNGEDVEHSYLAAPPPNLGEVEAPLSEVPEAVLILHYNGRWGTYSRKNAPPQGPPLHNQWTWPANSSIRWLLPRDLGN